MSNKMRKLYRGDCLNILRDYIQPGSVVVQVKGGKVTPDSVKALSETWDGGFDRAYPVIQGHSVADLILDKPLNLPPQYGRKRSGRISA